MRRVCWDASVPANTRRWPNVGLLVGQRRRRWPNGNPELGQGLVSQRQRRWANIDPALGQRLVFAEVEAGRPNDVMSGWVIPASGRLVPRR